MFNRLRTRLTLTIVGLVIVPAIVVGGVVSVILFGSQETKALELENQVVARVAADIADYIGRRETEMDQMIRVNNLMSLAGGQQRQLIETLLSAEPAYDSLILVNSNGIQLAGASRRAVVQNGGVSEYDQTDILLIPLQTGTTYYSPVSFSPVTGEPFVYITIPIQNLQTGEYYAALVATVRFKPVWDILDAASVGNQQQLYAVDQLNRVVAHRNPSVVLRGTTYEVPADSANARGLDGIPTVLSSQNIELGGQTLTVIAELPRAVALRDAQTLLLTLAGIYLGSLLIAGVIGVLVANQITRPVEELTATVAGFSEGHLSGRVTLHSMEEINLLGATFNNMADRLQDTVKALGESVRQANAASAAAREANRLKSEFLATMSHELRTPLNAMIGFSEIMLTGMGGTLDQDATHMTERIHANSTRLLSLINDVLDLAKIEAKRIEVVAHPFSPREMAESLRGSMSSLATQKSIGFKVSVSPEMPELISGDRGLVERIATNLLSNALKFTNKGQVELSLGKVGKDRWVMSITDTGIGIPPHAREFIFDPFRQLDGSSQRAFGGTGLGLSIVRELAYAMGGTVQVESEVGVGSMFMVTLPLEMVATGQPEERVAVP